MKRRVLCRAATAAALLYLLLLIPAAERPVPKGAEQTPFAWNREAFWSSLEAQFQQARPLGCETLNERISSLVTSALIARGNDFPGNFSHIALVHVDEQTKAASVIEAHIERGVVVSSFAAYLADKKLRVMVLRLRADLSPLVANPLLPHQAASSALREATLRHIPYDFELNYRDHTKQFCSEVASAAYERVGVSLWMGISRVSSRGVTSLLSAFGARHFETQEPSDLEYDPQLRVIAEWRDPETLFQDHADNAVIDVMLEDADAGEQLDYPWLMLPFARLAKGYSRMLNSLGRVGPVPEGMSATAALRHKKFSRKHAALKARLLALAGDFKRHNGYTPPYWELVKLARQAKAEIKRKT